MAVFGAEQIQESTITSRYFDKYMIAVNIGNIIATLVIPLIQIHPTDYFIGYIIGISMLCASILLFILGYRYYIHIPPYDTVITNCIPVILNAFQSWRRYKNNTNVIKRTRTNSSSSDSQNASQNFRGENENSIRISERPSTFLDFAKAEYNGKFNGRIVDDVKSLRGALLVFILLIPYGLIYNQVHINFIKIFLETIIYSLDSNNFSSTRSNNEITP